MQAGGARGKTNSHLFHTANAHSLPASAEASAPTLLLTIQLAVPLLCAASRSEAQGRNSLIFFHMVGFFPGRPRLAPLGLMGSVARPSRPLGVAACAGAAAAYWSR